MWKCKKCKTKNNNSSLKCHGPGCDGTKIKSAVKPKEVKVETKPPKIKRIYDFCPACKKDTVSVETRYKGKQAWRCTNAVHRPSYLRGKSKPFPPGLLEKLEAKDLEEFNKKLIETS